MKLSDVKRIAQQTEFEQEANGFNMKKLRMDEYEKLEDVQVLDSAFPIDWSRAVSDHFNVRNIGNWAWAYGKDDFRHGTPVPCCERSLVLFESMIGSESPLVYSGFYQD